MQVPQDLTFANRAAAERWIRSQARTVTVSDSTVVSLVLGKYLLYLDMRDASLAPHLALEGYWEYWITQFLAKQVRPGHRVLDVGANVGYFSVLMADLVGERGKVLSYEPVWTLSQLLKKSIAVNGFESRVKVIEAAASSKQGQSELHLPGVFMGSGHMGERRGHLEGLGYQSIPIQTVRLDEEPVPDLIKIDAEGHEVEVLNGMQGWFDAGCRPALLMEWDPSFYADDQLLRRVQRLGYQLAKVADDANLVATSLEELRVSGSEMLWLTT